MRVSWGGGEKNRGRRRKETGSRIEGKVEGGQKQVQREEEKEKGAVTLRSGEDRGTIQWESKS